MAFLPVKAPALIALLLLVVCCFTFTVFGDDQVVDAMTAESPHNRAPTYPPAKAPKTKGHHHTHHNSNKLPPSPSQPPVQTPTPAPSHPSPVEIPPPSHSPPSQAPHPKRNFVAVQGVVYCKSCKYSGVDTLLEATPLAGAVVRLQCNNTKYPLVQEAKTDKNGYFIIIAPKNITTFGSHKCKVSLVSSPLPACSKPTNLHYGEKGAILMPQKPPAAGAAPLPPPPPALPYQLFTVGPFAFEPSTKCSR